MVLGRVHEPLHVLVPHAGLAGELGSGRFHEQADALGTLETFDPNSLLSAQQDAMGIVAEQMENRLEKDVPILRVYPDMIETDSVDFPKVQLEYFVLMEDGKIYNLTLCWPVMELVKVYIRD